MSMGDIAVVAVLLLAVGFAVRRIIRTKKQGGCCGDCRSCDGCRGKDTD